MLRPGGHFVAVTNGDGHLADLLTEAGGAPLQTRFSRENGAAALRRHFGQVEQTDIDTWAHFDNHQAACDYLAMFAPDLATQLPPFSGARDYPGATSVFLCRP